MGRKRGFGDESSSDDDFQPPDGAASSRLKRVRRASTRERVGRRRGTQESEGDGEVICIPESIEEEEQGQEDSGVEETLLSEGEAADGRDGRAQQIDASDAEGEDEEDAGHDRAHGTDGNDGGDEDANNGNGGDESDGTVQKDDEVIKKRTRRVPNANASSFASSDSESEASEDDGDVYNSEDDEPNDSDAESDFVPSPKKSKRASKSSAKAKNPPPKTVRKPLANAKSSLNVRKPTAAKRSPAVTPTGGKKRLGARIPSRLSALGKTPGGGAQKARPAATAKTGALMYRAGLSRNAAIPPLHSYLRKSQ